jgi:hypothetical protein
VNSKSEIDRKPLGVSFIAKGWRRFGPGVDLSAATVHKKNPPSTGPAGQNVEAAFTTGLRSLSHH